MNEGLIRLKSYLEELFQTSVEIEKLGRRVTRFGREKTYTMVLAYPSGPKMWNGSFLRRRHASRLLRTTWKPMGHSACRVICMFLEFRPKSGVGNSQSDCLKQLFGLVKPSLISEKTMAVETCFLSLWVQIDDHWENGRAKIGVKLGGCGSKAYVSGCWAAACFSPSITPGWSHCLLKHCQVVSQSLSTLQIERKGPWKKTG